MTVFLCCFYGFLFYYFTGYMYITSVNLYAIYFFLMHGMVYLDWEGISSFIQIEPITCYSEFYMFRYHQFNHSNDLWGAYASSSPGFDVLKPCCCLLTQVESCESVHPFY